jgi:hypothetical protein
MTWSSSRSIAALLLTVSSCVDGVQAQSSDLALTLTAAPVPVAPGDLLTISLRVANRASGNVDNLIVGIEDVFDEPYVEAIAPAGLSITRYRECFLEDCSAPFYGISIPTLASGASATLSMVVRVVSPPGASLRAVGLAATPPRSPGRAFAVSRAQALVAVAGSGTPPTAPSQLSSVGVTPAGLDAASFQASDFTWDRDRRSYVLVGTANGAPAMTVTDSQGRRANVMRELHPATAFDRPRAVFSPHLRRGPAPGGVMLAWSDAAHNVYTQAIFTQNFATTSPALLGPGRAPQIAYSALNREFLVTWVNGARIFARRVDLDAQPIGPALEIVGTSVPAISLDSHALAWNPLTNEFGLAYLQGHSSPGRPTIDFARLGADGALLMRVELARAWVSSPRAILAVNERSGEFIVLWEMGAVFGAEVSARGEIVSRGRVADSALMRHVSSLEYSAVSGTFLATGMNEVVELNQYGAPLAAPYRPAIGGPYVAASRSDAAEWRLVGFLGSGSPSDPTTIQTEALLTSSIDGGSTERLGGCVSHDPFVAFGGGVCHDGGWLPPGLAAPGTTPSTLGPNQCATPDPFVALGGGRCINGGWLPPGVPTPGPTSCATPDPFVVLGGGVCANGGWLPPGHPLLPSSSIAR